MAHITGDPEDHYRGYGTPVLIGVPDDNTVECGVQDIPPVPNVTATDNCDLNVSVVFTEVVVDGTCPGNYTIIRTWVASDNCGNGFDQQQSLWVITVLQPLSTLRPI
ncbi:MAG: hypothetical protein R2787_00220 [Saprospiraceae bacterium]